jgi:hypothetical protein
MFETIGAFWSLFKAGEAVEDPAKWKARQITATTIGTLILAGVHVAEAFGHPLPIDAKSADEIGGGVLAVANIVLTFVANRDIGVSPGAKSDQ